MYVLSELSPPPLPSIVDEVCVPVSWSCCYSTSSHFSHNHTLPPLGGWWGGNGSLQYHTLLRKVTCMVYTVQPGHKEQTLRGHTWTKYCGVIGSQEIEVTGSHVDQILGGHLVTRNRGYLDQKQYCGRPKKIGHIQYTIYIIQYT